MVFTTLDIFQLKKINDCENIYSVNPLYLIIDKRIGHIEENNQNKHLVFNSSDENKGVLRNTQNFGMGLKIKLKSQIMTNSNMVKIS